MDSSFVRFFRRLQSLVKLFRFLELCIVLLFLSWLSSRVPFAVRISGEYCRRFSAFILSPISIFLLGNSIAVALFAKSGLFSAETETSSSIDNAVAKFYQELRSENTDEIPPIFDEKELVYQDEEIIREENTKSAKLNNDDDDNELDFPDERVPEVKTSYRRSQSEIILRKEIEKDERNDKLRRSETDVYRRDLTGGEESAAGNDDGEEFRRTIEAFIAKQARFHREEGLAIILHGRG